MITYEEYQKCINDIDYFYNKYVVVHNELVVNKKIMKRETLEGRNYEEIKSLYLKHFTTHPEHENCVRLIEKVTDQDGGCNFIIKFNHNPYHSAVGIEYDDAIKIMRREKLKKICQ